MTQLIQAAWSWGCVRGRNGFATLSKLLAWLRLIIWLKIAWH
jgi:hypothetical protein